MKLKTALLSIFSLVLSANSHVANADTSDFTSPLICSSNGRSICYLESTKRYQLQGNIAHYEMDLIVGRGPFNKISLHRIVKENRLGNPRDVQGAVMMVHGDAYGFASFMSSVNSQIVAKDQSIAIQMAASGLDVWGVDLRWTKVPESTTNLDFMANWGLETDLNDLDVAINVARNIRRIKEGTNTKMNLLGWSRGGQLGYLYLAKESTRPFQSRNIKAFVPVDILLKTNDETIRQSACLTGQGLRAQMAAGKYYDESGLASKNLALLAQLLPDEPSPVLEGFTNRQAVLFVLTATYATMPPGTSYTPWYHYNGGQFDELGLPSDLAFTQFDYLLEYAVGAAPYEPARLLAEAAELTCNETPSKLDDHLADISVPILYIYSAGGFGKTGIYTTRLTASRDISVKGVQTLPDELAILDFAHIDLFTGKDANRLIWQDIIRWMKRH